MIEDLMGHLDRPSLWIIRGGATGVMAMDGTLRGALKRAFELSANKIAPGSIVEMPNDQTVVPPEQVFELWKRLDFFEDRGHGR
jgi:hypothetical protein